MFCCFIIFLQNLRDVVQECVYDKYLGADKRQSGSQTCAGVVIMLLKANNKNGGRHSVTTQGFHIKHECLYLKNKAGEAGGGDFCCCCLASWGADLGISAGNDRCAL